MDSDHFLLDLGDCFLPLLQHLQSCVCFSKCVPAWLTGLPELNGLFTEKGDWGPKVRVTEL